MTKADYVVACGFGLIIGGVAVANPTAGLVTWGIVNIVLAALFGLTEAKNG